MITKQITYEGIDGDVTEEFLFHITRAQIMELNLPYIREGDEDLPPEQDTGLVRVLQEIIASRDNVKIYNHFKDILFMAVGKREGARFVKNEVIRADFESMEAYGELIIELMEDSAKAAAFFNGIMPKKLQEASGIDTEANKRVLAGMSGVQQTTDVAEPPVERRTITKAQAVEMDGDELASGLATGTLTISG